MGKVSVKGSYSESHFKEDRKYDAFSSGVQLMDIDNGRYNADISTILTYAIGRSHSLKAGVNYNRISELNSYKNLGGIHIFLTEFHIHLGERSLFLIPEDIEARLSRGSRERYDSQYCHFRHLHCDNPSLQHLIDLINKYHRCYDQEGYITYLSFACAQLFGS